MKLFAKTIPFLVLSLCFALYGIVVRAEVSNSQNKLELSSYSYYKNGKNLIDVTVSADFSASGIQGVLTFDSSSVSYCDVSVNDKLKDLNTGADSIKINKDTVYFVLANKDSLNAGDGWITFTFSSRLDIVSKAQFSLRNVKAVASDGSTVDTVISGCTGEVNGYLIGDINDDAAVNIVDLVRFKKYFSKAITADMINSTKADCNSDKVIDSLDLACLRKILLGIA